MKLYKVESSKFSQFCLEISKENYYLLITEKDVRSDTVDFLVQYRKKREINGDIKQIPMDKKVLRFLLKYVFNLDIHYELARDSLKEIKYSIKGLEY